MNKILLLLVLTAAISCNGNKAVEETVPASDTLMDSTTIQMKADTTVRRLDNLEDSIKRLRDKAAEQN